MNPQQQIYEKEYAQWVQSLSTEEREELRLRGLDRPARDEEYGRHETAARGDGMSFSAKTSRQEPDAYKLATLAEASADIEIICGRTPFDFLVQKELESDAIQAKESDIMAAKVESVAGILSYLFKPKNGKEPTPCFDILQRIYALAYCIRPSLIEGWSLERIGQICGGKSRAAMSKEVLKLNNYGLKARTAKSVEAVSVYAENTKEWHAERKAKAKREARLEYLRNYQKERRAEKKAQNAAYYEENKSRISAKRKESRSSSKKKAK